MGMIQLKFMIMSIHFLQIRKFAFLSIIDFITEQYFTHIADFIKCVVIMQNNGENSFKIIIHKLNSDSKIEHQIRKKTRI